MTVKTSYVSGVHDDVDTRTDLRVVTPVESLDPCRCAFLPDVRESCEEGSFDLRYSLPEQGRRGIHGAADGIILLVVTC